MKSVIVAIALPLIAGCATPKYWGATGGNPSDGLVQLFYVHTPFEYGQIRASQGLAIATGVANFGTTRALSAQAHKNPCAARWGNSTAWKPPSLRIIGARSDALPKRRGASGS